MNFYKSGKAEASNNLGFCAFMRMDFEKAEKFHKDVYSLTKNELELLVERIDKMYFLGGSSTHTRNHYYAKTQ